MRYGIDREVILQTDWGEEFGGSNPEKLAMLEEKYYQPLGAHLARWSEPLKLDILSQKY